MWYRRISFLWILISISWQDLCFCSCFRDQYCVKYWIKERDREEWRNWELSKSDYLEKDLFRRKGEQIKNFFTLKNVNKQAINRYFPILYVSNGRKVSNIVSYPRRCTRHLLGRRWPAWAASWRCWRPHRTWGAPPARAPRPGCGIKIHTFLAFIFVILLNKNRPSFMGTFVVGNSPGGQKHIRAGPSLHICY